MYNASSERYSNMIYNRCGNSGLKLPALSLGLWHNFGYVDDFNNAKSMIFHAFDNGITHFDLANNYGPPYGSAEENFGRIIKSDMQKYRDEMIISSKAGFDMWPGPYGNWGSKKYLMASCDQSLKRMGLDYVDIFYHHRPDPETPLEETMHALAEIVRQGKALYAGVSRYSPEKTKTAASILKSLNTPLIIHQPKYSMLDREPEQGLLDTLQKTGLGSIAFSPLKQGLLTDKYLNGIPKGSRADKSHGHLKKDQMTKDILVKIKSLYKIAKDRGQSLAQMAIAWLLRDKRITSVLIGASSVNQLQENIESLNRLTFSQDELQKIEKILQPDHK